MKLLFVSPHPDDVELGCGGTMARYAAEGEEVHILQCLGAGDLLMRHSGEVVTYEERVQEQKRAAEHLGVAEVWYTGMGVHATTYDRVGHGAWVDRFDRFLKHGYDQVYVPLPSHASDHRVIFDAFIAALRPTKADHTEVFAYEQPTHFHGPQVGGAINCSHYVRLLDVYYTLKVSALNEYSSQFGGRDDTIAGLAGVELLAQMRGLEIGVPYAERFIPIRSIV